MSLIRFESVPPVRPQSAAHPALLYLAGLIFGAGTQGQTTTPDKSQFNLFNPTPVDLRRAYNTDRPSKTDSPYTIDAGVFQIETDLANWTLDENKAIRIRTWIIGQTNFKLGVTNWMDLQIFPSAAPAEVISEYPKRFAVFATRPCDSRSI